MGPSWRQGPLSERAVGRFLVPDPLPERLLYAEPLHRRMRGDGGPRWGGRRVWACRGGRPAVPSTDGVRWGTTEVMQGMDQERARALLREERHRLERLRASVDADHDRVAPADEVSEDLADGADRRTLEETDEAVARQLTSRLEALQRAEDRLAAGTYGRSVLSGRPIPDERLEAVPLAEL